jgi:hypothetical protein
MIFYDENTKNQADLEKLKSGEKQIELKTQNSFENGVFVLYK